MNLGKLSRGHTVKVTVSPGPSGWCSDRERSHLDLWCSDREQSHLDHWCSDREQSHLDHWCSDREQSHLDLWCSDREQSHLDLWCSDRERSHLDHWINSGLTWTTGSTAVSPGPLDQQRSHLDHWINSGLTWTKWLVFGSRAVSPGPRGWCSDRDGLTWTTGSTAVSPGPSGWCSDRDGLTWATDFGSRAVSLLPVFGLRGVWWSHRVMEEKATKNSSDTEFRPFGPMDGSGAEAAREADDSPRAPATCCQRFFAWDGALLVLSLAGAVVGFAVGFTLYYFGVSSAALVWIGLPGELYMRMLKGAILPLIVSSIISGTAGLKPKENGRVSLVAMTYIIITNITGAIVGTVLAVIIKPGATEADQTDSTVLDTGNLQTPDLFADLIRNLVPDNVVAACFQKTQTGYTEKTTAANTTELVRELGTSSGTNILGLVIASAAVGMAAAQIGEVARPFLNFFTSASEVIIRLVQWMIWLTPIGVASLIAKAIASTTDLVATFKGLGLFVLAEVIGDFVAGVVFIAIIYFAFLRKNPFTFLVSASRAVITLVASASSAVAMPEVLNCVENRHHVDTRVSRFVVPLATALNRDGSAMFIACTSVYMAQLQGAVEASNLVLITVLASVGSLATPGVPSSSIVTILMILASLDIPPANLGIVIALEWFSDRMRAIPNANSHVLCAVLTWHLCKKGLGFEDSKPAASDLKAPLPPTSEPGKADEENTEGDTMNSRL